MKLTKQKRLEQAGWRVVFVSVCLIALKTAENCRNVKIASMQKIRVDIG